jgi:hypothetical protein
MSAGLLPHCVITGLVPVIHAGRQVFRQELGTPWMPGSSPGMTKWNSLSRPAGEGLKEARPCV